ncbi:MAG TPA: hypothetical protein VGE74_07030 [Gemmata sp.]
MRTIVGVIAVLGLAVAAARAQPPRERGASFRPPEPASAGDLPSGVVARGASEEFPPSSFLPSTPVARPDKGASPGRGPAWLSGNDPNVRTAAGSAARTGNVRPPAPTPLDPKDDPYFLPKGLEKIRPLGRSQPNAPQQHQAPEPTASTPFRGTGANGAPVYAGPPAYRWYGYGTVTPGANQFAPTGQYPRVSANWYSITGATPGAFPVPVMNPLRSPPGTEPPSYATAKPAAPSGSVVSVAGPPPQVPLQPAPRPTGQTQPQPRPLPLDRPEPPRFNPTGESKFAPTAPKADPVPPTISVPQLTPPPVPLALAPVAPPALPPVVPEPAPVAPVPPAPKPEAVAAAPPVIPQPVVPPPAAPAPPAPVFPAVEPAKPVAADAPSPLPISLMGEPKPVEPPAKVPEPRREEYKWQPAPEPAVPAPGTWAPARTPVPQATAPVSEAPAWKSGAASVKPIVARAQMADNAPDPVETLIRQMCQGRADGLDIRWAGTKKLMVCFEVRTTAEAQKLVTDISRRPELAPYQIDFCALVKK